MKISVIILLLQLAILNISNAQTTTRSEGQQYYDTYVHIIFNYLSEMEGFLKGTRCDPRMHEVGGIKNTAEDSVKIVQMANNFSKVKEEAKAALQKHGDFQEFNLINPTIQFVEHSSTTILNYYMPKIVFPLVTNPAITEEQWITQCKDFMKELDLATDELKKVNRSFMDKFKVVWNRPNVQKP